MPCRAIKAFFSRSCLCLQLRRGLSSLLACMYAREPLRRHIEPLVIVDGPAYGTPAFDAEMIADEKRRHNELDRIVQTRCGRSIRLASCFICLCLRYGGIHPLLGMRGGRPRTYDLSRYVIDALHSICIATRPCGRAHLALLADRCQFTHTRARHRTMGSTLTSTTRLSITAGYHVHFS